MGDLDAAPETAPPTLFDRLATEWRAVAIVLGLVALLAGKFLPATPGRGELDYFALYRVAWIPSQYVRWTRTDGHEPMWVVNWPVFIAEWVLILSLGGLLATLVARRHRRLSAAA